MEGIKELCNAIMKGVIQTGAVTDANMEKAVEIMRKETADFFTGEKYKNQRECIKNGTIHQNYIIADIITECVAQLTD